MPAKSRPSTKALTSSTARTEGEVLELETAVTDDVIERVYQDIVGLQRDATVALAVKMGKLIVENFYEGDLVHWRKHGKREVSLRKLAAKFESEDESSGMSAAGIFRVVAIYELDKRLDVSARKHLTATHIRSVIGLPASEQRRLLEESEKEEWTTRQLEDQAKTVRTKAGDGRGRPALPAWQKTTNLLGKLAIREDAFADLDSIDELEEDKAKEALTSVTGMRERLAEIEKRLETRLKRKNAASE